MFCFFLIHVTPVALAPYWMHFCSKEHDGAALRQDTFTVEPQYGCASGYLVGVLFSTILTTMYRCV